MSDRYYGEMLWSSGIVSRYVFSLYALRFGWYLWIAAFAISWRLPAAVVGNENDVEKEEEEEEEEWFLLSCNFVPVKIESQWKWSERKWRELS